MDRAALTRWIEAYERAWRTRGVEALVSLFTEDATYRTAPFEEPFRGLPAITAIWEEEREGPGEAFELESEVVARAPHRVVGPARCGPLATAVCKARRGPLGVTEMG